MEGLPIYGSQTTKMRTGVTAPGVFAQIMMREFPFLPMIEDGRLCEPRQRENWVSSVLCHAAFRRTQTTISALTTFHARHKYLIMAHSTQASRELGRMLGTFTKRGNVVDLRRRYYETFFRAMKQHPTTGQNACVLEHLLGHIKRHIDKQTKAEIVSAIHSYRKGDIPIIVPMRLIQLFFKLHARENGVDWASHQVFLQSTPADLKLTTTMPTEDKKGRMEDLTRRLHAL